MRLEPEWCNLMYALRRSCGSIAFRPRKMLNSCFLIFGEHFIRNSKAVVCSVNMLTERLVACRRCNKTWSSCSLFSFVCNEKIINHAFDAVNTCTFFRFNMFTRYLNPIKVNRNAFRMPKALWLALGVFVIQRVLHIHLHALRVYSYMR